MTRPSRRWRRAAAIRDQLRPLRDRALELADDLAGDVGRVFRCRVADLSLDARALGERKARAAMRPLREATAAELRRVNAELARLG